MAAKHPRAQTPLPTKKDRRLELWVAAVALVIGLVFAFWFTRNHVTAPASGPGAGATQPKP